MHVTTAVAGSAAWRAAKPTEADLVGSGGRRVYRPAALRHLVEAVAAQEDLWAERVRFDLDHRYRVRLHRQPDLELWLLCWDIGQDSLLHGHGGSVGAFAVARGALTEDHGERTGGEPAVRVHPAGSSVGFGADHVHNLANVSLHPAVSLHAYSGPLRAMDFYCWLGDRMHLLRRLACDPPPGPDTCTVPEPAVLPTGTAS
jgi:hypothetical protein